MRYLVDTNVLSELSKPSPNYGVVEWAEKVSQFAISAITVEETEFGLNAKPNDRVRAWFEEFVERHCTVLDVTEPIARRSGVLRGTLRSKGKTRTPADMLIAATAAQHGLTLVTRNLRDFEGCGIPVLDPFV
jgi:predicted nucleic acid-binding protein